MIKLFKFWLKEKLCKLLEIDDTIQQQLNIIVDEIVNLNEDMGNLHDDLVDHDLDIKKIKNTLQNVVHVATDVQHKLSNKSWAVICVEGKPNLIKFVDLSGQNTKEIVEFLRKYEVAQHVIDAPNNQVFFDGVFTFANVDDYIKNNPEE